MSNNIKENHIRHTQEALDDIFEGLKNQDKTLLSIAIDSLVTDASYIGDNDNHQDECIMVDYEVPKEFTNELYIEAWKRAKVVEAYLNHEMYDKYGHLWHDMVEELMMSLLKLLPDKKGEQ